ncbi:MAG: bacterial Ig-like domain-containing protein [Nitrososphaerota archaeon]|jgi:uncharacterized repeat protein (TIGR02543 family)|nr:bacterial Ig-like domain-containing protein [Nitrososphaerota archaeon]
MITLYFTSSIGDDKNKMLIVHNKESNVKRVLSTILVFVLVVGCFVAMPLTANAADESTETDPLDALIGTYEGSYTRQQELRATVEVYRNDIGVVEVTIEFYPDPNYHYYSESGKYLGSVTYNSEHRTYDIRAVEWIVEPPTYVFVDFLNGVLDETGNKLAGDVHYHSGPIGKISEFEFYRIHPVLESIAVTNLPKTNYIVGEALDLTGMIVEATYSNGDTCVLAADDYTTVPVNGGVLIAVGSQTITVSYTEKGVTETDSFEITVTTDNIAVYSITYVLNGGVNDAGNPSFYTTADFPLSIAVPTREGYSFDGWVVTYSDGRPSITVLIPYFTMSGTPCDLTLTAWWTEDQVKVVNVTPMAEVTKLTGNKNDLTITLTEELSDGTISTLTKTFNIANNAANTYTVGSYKVYVDTKGNTQIRACYLIT